MPPLVLSQAERKVIHTKLVKWFPNLTLNNYEVWGRRTDIYNCIAYAGNMGCDKPWWPYDPRLVNSDYYWPDCQMFIDTVENFIKAFRLYGYEVCDSREYEPGFEKVAIYEDPIAKKARHMARQTNSEMWGSKLGNEEEIRHKTLEAVESKIYGKVVQIMRRPTRNS